MGLGRWVDRVRLRVRSVVLGGRLEREMQEEMAEHLERSVERLIARGLSPEDARLEAMREFGNVAYLQEEGRNARGTAWLTALAEDTRFAWRQYARRWGTTLTMFVILSLGLSISTLLFTYVHGYAFLPPPGIALHEDLVRIRGSVDAGAAGRGPRALSEDEYEAYTDLSDHFRAVAGWAEATVGVDLGDEASVQGLTGEAVFVSGDYFGVLGVRPLLGPGLSGGPGSDPAAATSAVIGHAMWDRFYGRSPDVIGSTLQVNGVPVTVVGVAPPRFIGIGGASLVQLWLPLEGRHAVLPAASAESLAFRAAGRLQPGVTHAEATAAAGVVVARAAGSDEELAARGAGTEVVPLLSANGDPMHERDVRLMTVLLGILGLLVLGVACTNVSALQIGLALARRQEIAVRLSLGAGRRRIIRQLLTESSVLAIGAGATALAIVSSAFALVESRFPLIPFQVAITWETVAFTFGVALAVGLVFGLSPALHATRVTIASALQDSAAAITGTRLRLQRALVVAQIAFTQPLVVLLAAMLLLVLAQLQPDSPNSHADQLVSLRLRPATAGPGQTAPGPESTPRTEADLERLIARLESLPGVTAAVVDSWSTGELGPYAVHPSDRVEGGAQQGFEIVGQTASPGYFSATGIPLLRGRDFRPDDPGARQASEVPVVLDGALAHRLWPGADPIGRRLEAVGDSASGAPRLVVTGIVSDPSASENRGAHLVYLPRTPGPRIPPLLLRTSGPAEPLIPSIRGAVHDEVPTMTAGIQTVASLEAQARRTFRLVTGALAGSGFVALLLSAIGLYAVIAFAVGQRTREIAVRMAVGAPPRRIAGRFVADGVRLSALGLAIGLPFSLLGLRFYNSVAAGDSFPAVALPPVTLLAMTGILIVTVAATFLPARRAATVDPITSLRRE